MARDIIHDAVKNALIKDGWTVTHDPYYIKYGKAEVYIDLAAERLMAATRNDEKIVVEVKSFIGRSLMKDFQNAIGQYLVYENMLRKSKSERIPFLALNLTAYRNLIRRPAFQEMLVDFAVHLIIVDEQEETVVSWIN